LGWHKAWPVILANVQGLIQLFINDDNTSAYKVPEGPTEPFILDGWIGAGFIKPTAC